ncbi:type VI secretion system membrane subunit TssM [Rhizobacter sp. Root1221]|uniref:type VI secretion system membrane subunit TssM n=1 Tax=Rhizobacter sp. Root1221 TaxID=1736433 RepID=UPI0007014DF2|nr:type VI secretion system membrane subunit TssM [Rhizobacter sp. Root1221]KQV78223.1 type VI secretion protein [Rhizobacter sp. Root1221]
MKKIFSLLFNPWLLLALGLLALSIVIWIVGPLVAIGDVRPLESPTSRWLLIGAILLVVALRKAWQFWRARQTNEKVVDQLIAPAKSASNDPADAELKTLGERFATALETLKRAKFDQGKSGLAGAWSGLSSRVGKRYLYELPWYVIIGAPGSGKTTALVNSGLKFPLAESMGEHAVRGVGGTRNCDWWFTDQAVLIDTAGRYTTQDSHKAADSKAWEGFLGLLKTARPRQPVNGVLVTVSVTDLLTRSAAERAQHAAAVRQRVQELHQQLGIRFPIYLLVTKCDLLSGFMETLGEVDKDTRATPWGMTFKLDREQHTDLAGFAPEFDALEKRLTDGLVDRLQLERDPQRRARIYGFPQQFEALRGLLKDYLEQVFSPSQFEAHPLLRGVYFVSGTQEGTPIDRMLGRIARTYRLERTVVPPNQSSGRSFFLGRLLSEVVFAESALAGTNLKWERRRGWFAVGAYAFIALFATVALIAWGTSYVNNQAYVAKVGGTVSEVRTLLQSTPNRASPDVMVLLPALEATRDLARAGIGDSVPVSYGFGLYQGRKLDSASQQAYRRMLIDAVLPRIALGIEERLKTGLDNPELQYEALKAYVMMYDPSRFDAAALKLYVLADWETNLPRSVTTEQRASLESHLDALLEEGQAVSPLPEDRALVAQVRSRLVSTPLTERIYRRLKRQGVGSDVPDFTIAKAAGPGAALVFTRASGQPLTKGVQGLFTFDGYHKGFQREVERVARQLADEEGWVLGVNDAGRQSTLRNVDVQQQLSDEVRRLYLTDYAATWEQFIGDVRMLPTANLAQAVQMSRVLSAPDNPLVPLLRAMSRETTLTDNRDVVAKAENTARDAVNRSREELLRLIGNRTQNASPLPPGAKIESLVDDRFVSLRNLVTGQGDKGPAPIDQTVGLIGEVYTQLSASDTAVKGGNVPPPSDVPNKVKAEAARLPEPVRSLLNTLSVSGTKATLDITRSNLGNALHAEVGDFCRQAISGRYPFDRNASRDVTTEDFARVFAPGGLFDAFFQKNLANFVNTTTKPWSFKAIDGASMGADTFTLAQFQNAAVIRDTFFRAGGNAPGLRLDFKPMEMDATITQFTLDIDGQVVKYAHGPLIPTSVQWPGPRGTGQVRVALQPVSTSGGLSGSVNEGPWALFKLFDRQLIEPAGAPERFKATFTVDGRKAIFVVSASSVRNPFRLPELQNFTCPGRL